MPSKVPESPNVLPLYLMRYFEMNGKIKENTTVLFKVSKPTKTNPANKNWGNIPVNVTSLDIEYLNDVKHQVWNMSLFHFDLEDGLSDYRLISKDVWVKYADKANKLIDEANKKGESYKRISY